ncbi:Uncharacterised protein [Mycobacteroides abscessus]|nr:Uncharacterised protein [Mycobacteroides abscessus]
MASCRVATGANACSTTHSLRHAPLPGSSSNPAAVRSSAHRGPVRSQKRSWLSDSQLST